MAEDTLLMTAQKPPRPPSKKAVYKPTLREDAVLSKQRDELAHSSPRVKLIKKDRQITIELEHPDHSTGLALLMEALGTSDLDFFNGLLNQVANVDPRGSEANGSTLNFMLSIIKGVEPRDQVEAMLAAQMAAVHISIMTFARRLAYVDNIPQQDSAERAFNKLTRTFATQMEALKRYRTGGEQKVTVQHVTVGEGGQAIVGNVTQAGREAAPEKAPAPALALTDAKTPPMPIIEAEARTPITAPRISKRK
jgi:hypothetical protein